MNSLLEHVSLLTRILGSPVAAVTLAASVPRDDAGDFDQKALGEELKHQGFENHLQKRPLHKIPQLALPAVILLRDGEAAVLKKLAGDEAANSASPRQSLKRNTSAMPGLSNQRRQKTSAPNCPNTNCRKAGSGASSGASAATTTKSSSPPSSSTSSRWSARST